MREADKDLPAGPVHTANIFVDAPESTHKTHKTPEAEDLGLTASWSHEFGYVTLHDPTTGEYHDVKTDDAPGWALGEARRRKELYKDGNRRAYRLTSGEMERLWQEEHPPEPDEGIAEDIPIDD